MLGGANSLTHWYWPPALGDMDAISASDATTGSVRIHVARKSHTVPALPPLIREKRLVLCRRQCLASIGSQLSLERHTKECPSRCT